MNSPTGQRRRSRILASSPLSTGRRRSGRLSFVPQPTQASNVKVCIRVRPPNDKERAFRDGKEILDILDQQSLVFDPVEIQTPSFHRGRMTRDPTARRNRDIKFGFGRVFHPDATNEEVFQETTQQTLDYLMKGINCSIFAYGATGAGKTHTMLGTPSNKGVIARTVHALYERIETMQETTNVELEVSYLEIYNEAARDLLKPTGKELILRETGGGGVVVAGLTFHKPASVDELFQMLETGNNNRTQHPTDANKESSRSHAVFHIYLKQKPRTADIATDIIMSKMALIDLAGSERAAATANCGARFREGANINKSLLALGNCINALAEGKQTSHVPYRNSKLTRILKDSLGGNCQTVMIAAVSSSAMSFDDTYNTLRYADRAQKIKLDLKSNVYRVEHSVHQYGKIVEQLQTENQDLKQRLEYVELEKRRLKKQLEELKRSGHVPRMSCGGHANSDVSFLSEKQINDLLNSILSFTQLQDGLLNVESQKRLTQLKLNHREKSQLQLNEVQSDLEKNQANGRWEKFRAALQQRFDQLAAQADRAEIELRDAQKILDDVFLSAAVHQNGYSDAGAGDTKAFAIKLIIDALKDRSDACQLRASERHLKAVLDCLNLRIDQQDRVIEAMGPLLKDQYRLLQSYSNGDLPPSQIARFESVKKFLDKMKEVTWSDQNGNLVGSTTQLSALPDYTVRKQGARDASFIVQNSVISHAATVTTGPSNATTSAATASNFVEVPPDAVAYNQVRYGSVPKFTLDDPTAGIFSSGEEDAAPPVSMPPPTPPKSNQMPSVVPKKGTPYRRRFESSSSDDGETFTNKATYSDETFTMEHDGGTLKNSPIANGIVNSTCGANNAVQEESSKYPKFSVGIPEAGRPSLPASRITPRVPPLPPRSHELDADGFKKPPVPERFGPKPKAEKPQDAAGRTRQGDGQNSHGRKPSVTSVRNSPLIRSPSQNSLAITGSKRDRPHDAPSLNGANGTNGSGLKRNASSMRNLRQWHY